MTNPDNHILEEFWTSVKELCPTTNFTTNHKKIFMSGAFATFSLFKEIEEDHDDKTQKQMLAKLSREFEILQVEM